MLHEGLESKKDQSLFSAKQPPPPSTQLIVVGFFFQSVQLLAGIKGSFLTANS